ncbi:MAG: M56 family metallopeptidase [Leptolyngbyaceae cyanobacterium bins.59]|nr:M56 family metallopeptidase [Leptolyngbyaceae cyanobacterium bins.59]
MHFVMILTGLVIAWCWRWQPLTREQSWNQRWAQTLSLFLLPPCLLLTTAIAVLWMGPHGWMVWHWEGWVSYGAAIGFLFLIGLLGLGLLWQGKQTLKQIQAYPTLELQGTIAHLLEIPTPYIAQVGFWHPRLVVTQGLLHTLEPEHLQAVLAHEQVHARHHDTFWFFALGWVRRWTCWLPQTDTLWQELLVLRELRADREASQLTDPLLLAESLLKVVSDAALPTELSAAFGGPMLRDRLEERINALLDDGMWEEGDRLSPLWVWLPMALLPFAVVPFHA